MRKKVTMNVLLALLFCALPICGQSAASSSYSQSFSDTLRSDTSSTADISDVPEIKVIRRKVRYREHVAMALFTMLFIALAMTTAQSFNPD